MKLPQKASLGPEMCEIGSKVAMWGIRWTGFPLEDSPLLYRASTGTLGRPNVGINWDDCPPQLLSEPTLTACRDRWWVIHHGLLTMSNE